MNDIATASPPPTTKRDLIEKGVDALDRSRVNATTVSHAAGGVTFATALEVMDFAKMMAVADTGVPPHLRANPGTCMRIVFQAIEWRMSPFAVADKSYVVKDRLAYESQLIHAVIEARAPLQKRLDCEYAGEGGTRTCTVIGCFTDGETRTYTSPMFKDIGVKNSPLWVNDPDQQLWYYASRSWARKWCPDVLMGIYSKEELQADPTLGREDEPAAGSGLHARLAGSTKSDEGHRPGHAASELDNIAAGGDGAKIIEATAEPAKTDTQPASGDATEAQADKPATRKRKGDKTPSEPAKAEATPGAVPTTAAEYWPYAIRWIDDEKLTRDDAWARWEGEREMRDSLSVTIGNRNALEARIRGRFPEAK